MHSFHISDYAPKPGQLCRTFKGKDSVYPVAQEVNCLVSEPLTPNEIILITKAVYHEELSSYYIEFMRGSKLFYTYFYEQILCFEDRGDEIIRFEDPETTFDYPWVLCEE